MNYTTEYLDEIVKGHPTFSPEVREAIRACIKDAEEAPQMRKVLTQARVVLTLLMPNLKNGLDQRIIEELLDDVDAAISQEGRKG